MVTIRAVQHVHSTYSYDGKESLSRLKELFVEQGVNCVLMTEHTDELTEQKAEMFVTECKKLSDEEFIFIPGFEVPYKKSHILMLGAHEFVAPKADELSLRRWRDKADLAVLAHPHRNNFVIDMAMRDVIDGIEVWNAQYDGKIAPRFSSLALVEETPSLEGDSLLRFGGLDLHRKEHLEGPVLEMEVEALVEQDILVALSAGEYIISCSGVYIPSKGVWNEPAKFILQIKSILSLVVIVLGKWVNKILKGCGVSLPKHWKEKIRTKI